MKLQTLPLAALLVLTFANTGAALPPPCEEAAMEMDATLIVTGMVSEASCVGEPVTDDMKTVTTYLSTLQVTEVLKGDSIETVSITGLVVEYADPANEPVGDWNQPAYPVGTKGKFFLVADEANEGQKLVCWNGFLKDEDSVVDGTLPECGGDAPPVDPPEETEPYAPNECWAEKCAAEYGACKEDASCVAYSLCIGNADDADACFEQFMADYPDAPLTENGAHSVYLALQECGWSACNDPNAASCSDPGKDGAENRCGQYDATWPCNCDDACSQYGDCCADYEDTCAEEPTPVEGSCADPGLEGATNRCGQYDESWTCFCDPDCLQFNDCCPDYEEVCAEPCQPVCDGKDCGDDGCGGSCGTCNDGFSCSENQMCVEDEPACENACAEGDKGCNEDGTPWTCAMAGSGCYEKFAGAACADSETCTDGTCGTAGPDPSTNPEPNATGGDSDDGGCATSTQSSTSGWLLLALVLLLLAVRRESDQSAV